MLLNKLKENQKQKLLLMEKKIEELKREVARAKDEALKAGLHATSERQRIEEANKKKADHLKYFHAHIMKTLKLQGDQ